MSAVAPGYSASRQEVEDYIRQAAEARGIDPEVAMTVYKREGAGSWQSSVVKDGVREPSYGPFQLYTGGGLGNEFQKDTGLDPSDPNTWRQGVDYALDKAKSGGWGPWYGAKAAGITGFMGINGQPGPQTASAGGLLAQRAPSPADQSAAAGLLAQLAGNAPSLAEGQQQGGGILGRTGQPQQPEPGPSLMDASQQQMMRRRPVKLAQLPARPSLGPWTYARI